MPATDIEFNKASTSLSNQKNETPYAIVKLDEAARVVKQSIAEFPTLRKRLEKQKERNKTKAREIYDDLRQQHRRLLDGLGSMALSLLEMDLPDLAEYSVTLKASIQAFNLMTPDYGKLCEVLGGFLDKLPISETPEAKTTNAAIIGRLMSNVKMGYYPTDSEHVDHLVRGIEFPEGVTTNLFDPCCGCGLALRAMAEGNNCYTYGVELDRHRAEESLTRLHRVGFGSFHHSRIANEAFHAVLLNPPYLWTMTEGGSNTRSEKRFMVETICHLMYGGLLIYIIPHYRLTADICRVICDNFTDLTVWKFMGAEYKRYKQVAVMGIRQKRGDGSDMVPALSSLVLAPNDLPELSELPENRYPLPATAKKVELFKGAEFNVAELAEQLKKSASFSRLFEKNKLDSAARRPLLPLNIGQVGLIGGSGLINGLVDCDYPHIIKGRVVKENNVKREENHDSRGHLMSTTLYEVRSNKLIFNVLTPQGFLSLTDYVSGNSSDGIGNDNDIDDHDAFGVDEECGVEVLPHAPNATIVATVSKPLFPLGQTVVTANANSILNSEDIYFALKRHEGGNWGEVCDVDSKANSSALKHGDRILSAYISNSGHKFWVITEADRSYTTVLMPEDY